MNQWDATSLITCAKFQSVEESDVVQELVEENYERILQDLHGRYQQGELTFRSVAAELGLSVRELYDLLEQKGLST